MSDIKPDTGVEEVAAIISEALEAAGIIAVLSGGAAVTIYTENQYESFDLDFVSSFSNERIRPVMEALGFRAEGNRLFVHAENRYMVEFPPGPLTLGNEIASAWGRVQTLVGVIQILTPTQSVKDRLSGYYHWKDMQNLDQALGIARNHPIDMQDIESWSEKEGHHDRFLVFKAKLGGAD